jgi:amidase
MNQQRRAFLKQTALFSLAAAGDSLLNASAMFSAQMKQAQSELAKYDALGIAELIRKKQITALEAVEDVIRRIERVNPQINAVLTKNFDLEKARARARQISGEGMFAGAPVMLKNLTQYKDARIDSGSRLSARYLEKGGVVAQQNSPLVDAMERAGMIITGICNSPELGLIDSTEPILHGPTRNPWKTDFTSGGSSGGSAAAIAAGIIPLAHGNDGGGSIRVPASQCGVFGLKPSRRRELGNGIGARGGGIEALNISNNLCLSRSVRDTAAFLNAVENKNDPNLPPVGFISGPSKKRLKIALVLEALNGKQPHPEVEKAIRSTAKLCEKLGHKIEEVKPDINGAEFTDAFTGLWASGTVRLEQQAEQWLGKGTKLEDVLEPWTLGLIELAKRRGVQACWQKAIAEFGKTAASVEKLFQTYDVILSPALRNPPHKIGWHDPRVEFNTLLARVFDDVGYTPLHNACGTPAMSAPLYWTPDGLPVGSQFAAWRGGEATLLHLAYELEAARPWAKKRAPVFAP